MRKYFNSEILSDILNVRSILAKMVSVFLLLIAVPAVVNGYISTTTASDALRNTTEDGVMSSTMQTSQYFDLVLEKVGSISMQVLTNEAVQKYGQDQMHETDQRTSTMDKQNAINFINATNSTSPNMNAAIVFDNGEALGSITSELNMDKVKNAAWYKKASESSLNTVWADINREIAIEGNESYAVSMIRSFRSGVTNEHIGTLMVNIKYDEFVNTLSNINLGKKDKSYLLTDGGMVLSAKGNKEDAGIGQMLFIRKVKESIKAGNKGYFYTNEGGTDYLVSYHKSPKYNWTAITIIPKEVIISPSVDLRNKVSVMGVVFAIIAIIIGFAFSVKMSEAIKTVSRGMSRAENGDLTVSLSMHRKDEIGRLAASFNSMVVRIRELIEKCREVALSVEQSAVVMKSISEKSSLGTVEISRSITEVASGASSTAQEIESGFKNVSQLAERINSAVEHTVIVNAESKDMKVLTLNSIKTIDVLNKRTAETNELAEGVVSEIREFNENIKNINKITNILKGVADQTNLLALNAAIEASRAGEAGKGFSVVADEIRKLAEQSNGFTKEIQSLIGLILIKTQKSTELILKTEASIKEQSGMVSQTAEAFAKINSSTAVISERIDSIATIMTDMDSNKKQVMASMENISAVSEESAASSEEVASMTEEQLASFEELDGMVKQVSELVENLVTVLKKFNI